MMHCERRRRQFVDVIVCSGAAEFSDNGLQPADECPQPGPGGSRKRKITVQC